MATKTVALWRDQPKKDKSSIELSSQKILSWGKLVFHISPHRFFRIYKGHTQALRESPISLEVMTAVRLAKTEILLVLGLAAVCKCFFLYTVSSMWGNYFSLL